jgi:hypothetical protein
MARVFEGNKTLAKKHPKRLLPVEDCGEGGLAQL